MANWLPDLKKMLLICEYSEAITTLFNLQLFTLYSVAVPVDLVAYNLINTNSF
uniref:Uncharacterized protein n=1 Tax=Rhizophora mucronata TaxID=61149 RepID=A0A2P2L9J8_RHIMU